MHKQELPIVFLKLTNSCNSKCITCEHWWSRFNDDIKLNDVDIILEKIKSSYPTNIIITWWEALLHKEIFTICERIKVLLSQSCLRLLTNWLLLNKYLKDIGEFFDRVIISYDAHNKDLYKKIRWVDWFDLVNKWISSIKKENPGILIKTRVTIQKLNFRFIREIVIQSLSLWIDQVSFLVPDTKSEIAFNRRWLISWENINLSEQELLEFNKILSEFEDEYNDLYKKWLLCESLEYFRSAFIGHFENILNWVNHKPWCNVTSKSVIIEPNLDIKPCFFIPTYWNISDTYDLKDHMNPKYFKEIEKYKESTNVCDNCVCSIYL